MRPIPWRRRADPVGGHRYLVFVGVLVLDRWRNLPKFLRLTLKARRDIRRARGVAGYALAAWFPTRTFTAVAAFEDREALRGFTAMAGHADASNGMRPHLGRGSKFVTYEVYGRDLPPEATDVATRLEAIPGLGEFDGPAGHPVAGGETHHPA